MNRLGLYFKLFSCRLNKLCPFFSTIDIYMVRLGLKLVARVMILVLLGI